MKNKLLIIGLMLLSVVIFPSKALGHTVFTVNSQKYVHNGKNMTMDISPVIINSRALVPLRYLAESCSATVSWDSATKTITLNSTLAPVTVQMTIGSNVQLVNGRQVNMDVTPVIMKDRTMIPARWVAEPLLHKVHWEASNKTVSVFPEKVAIDVAVQNLRQGPSLDSAVTGELYKGTVLSVLQAKDNWYQVSINSDGKASGWIAGWLTRATAQVAGENPQPPETSPPARVSVDELLKGKGVWTSIYTPLPDSSFIERFRDAGIKRIYLQVGRSNTGFTPEYRSWVDTLVPMAHANDIKVIGWVYTNLKDPANDRDIILAAANYRTPDGHRLDGIGADIEELPADTNQAAAMVSDFALQVRKGLPSDCPLLAITYPPQQRPKYPFDTMAAYFDGIVLMDYWRTEKRDYSPEEVKTFVKDSIARLKQSASDLPPVEVALQGFEGGKGLPRPEELIAAVEAAEEMGVGHSLYCYNTGGDTLWDVFTRKHLHIIIQ